jgi:F0F1-type ATP synthase membrane subunit c/vacuolar-type H+-ATPase subunit K
MQKQESANKFKSNDQFSRLITFVFIASASNIIALVQAFILNDLTIFS